MKKRLTPFLLCMFVASSPGQVSPHGSTKFACRTCHSADSVTIRTDSTFDHTVTQFVLGERHRALKGVSCHKTLTFSLQGTQCMSCHPDVHKGVLGERCAECHVTQAWLGAHMMRQHEQGRFLLTGAHEAVACKMCHIGGNFTLEFRGCEQCHDGLFGKTTRPDHAAAKFAHDCMRCHSTRGWSPATFDHSTTHFSLNGVHATAPCRSCHVNDNYGLQYVDCYQCHQSRFELSVNPNHVAGSFPHDCNPCHSATAWRPSTFMHDDQNFRIFRGKHRTAWSACSDCHQNTANFKVFSCVTCHGQTETNGSHVSIGGYAYASPACYSCHRDS